LKNKLINLRKNLENPSQRADLLNLKYNSKLLQWVKLNQQRGPLDNHKGMKERMMARMTKTDRR